VNAINNNYGIKLSDKITRAHKPGQQHLLKPCHHHVALVTTTKRFITKDFRDRVSLPHFFFFWGGALFSTLNFVVFDSAQNLY
jgi:hypothetical protein